MEETITFPSLETRSLDGRRLRLPGELPGELNLVVVAFERRQQEDVDSWAEGTARLRVERPDLEFIEIPCISRRWTPARWFIDGGMTAAIPDPGVRARTLTAYTDVDRVLRALGLEGCGVVRPVLTDRSGVIHWHGTGPYEREQGTALRAALARLDPAAS